MKLLEGGVRLFDLCDLGCAIVASKFNFSPSILISTSRPFFENDSCSKSGLKCSTVSRMPRNSTFLPMVRLNVLFVLQMFVSGIRQGSILCCHTLSVLLPEMWFSRYLNHCFNDLKLNHDISGQIKLLSFVPQFESTLNFSVQKYTNYLHLPCTYP